MSVSAQTTTHTALSVTVLRSNGANIGSAGDSVDAALLRDLPSIAGIDHAQLSPIEYEEIQLTVGCQDQSRDCLVAIAGMAQVSGLVVRTIVSTGSALQLDLVYFDASSQDEPSHASVSGDASALVNAVPSLVRKLFGIPEVVTTVAAPVDNTNGNSAPVAATSTSSADTGGINTLTVAGIATLGVGTAVGLVGVLMGLSASGSFDDYKQIDVVDRASAQAANDTFDDAESKATAANALLPIGGALVVGGAVMLVLGLNAEDEAPGATTVSVAPTLHGGVMLISGAL